jgi:hypothetical protein
MNECRYYAKYKGMRQPKCGCSPCWTLYFIKHPMRYVTVKNAIEAVGKVKAATLFGDKLVKHYYRFRKEHGAEVERLVDVHAQLLSDGITATLAA